jgi:translation initiation factor IF-3
VKRDDQYLGILPIQQALDMAFHAGLDLVEMVPGRPDQLPVCYIMDWGKHKFEEKIKKRQQAAKAKSAPLKEARLRPVSNDHDVEIKINQVKRWLEEKHPVLLNIKFKNRELQHREQGHRIMTKILEALAEVAKIESPPRFDGDRLAVRLAPKSA